MAFHRSEHTGHAIRQLQGVWQAVVSGAAADTNIAVTGVKVGDEVKVLAFNSGVPSVPTGTASVTAADTIQVTSDTTGLTLVVTVYPTSH